MNRDLLFQDADGNKIYPGDMVEWRMQHQKGTYWGESKWGQHSYCMIHKFRYAKDGYYAFDVTETGTISTQIARDYELRKVNLDRLVPADVSWYHKFKEEVKL
jgi:hypothetical protein